MKYILFILIAINIIYNTYELVHSPPRILQHPKEEIFYEYNSTVKLDCEGEGVPLPKFTWLKNGVPFEWKNSDNRISQEPGNGTLVITNLMETDAGQYQCFAENQHGTATSKTLFLRQEEGCFKDLPSIFYSSEEGKPLKLACSLPDTKPKYEIIWFIKPDVGHLRKIYDSRLTVDSIGNLWFSSLTMNDSSKDFAYVCGIHWHCSEYKLGNLNYVKVLPTKEEVSKIQPLFVSPSEVEVIKGKRVELFCLFSGNPLVAPTWTKDGVPMFASTDSVEFLNYGRSLLVLKADYSDAGVYTCQVNDKTHDGFLLTIKLNVVALPYFLEEPKSVHAEEHETVAIECKATGLPASKITWIYNGKPIEQALYNPRRTINNDKIVISDIHKEDTGNYGCNVSNYLGYVYKEAILNVLTSPPEILYAPNTLKATINSNLTITCKVIGLPKPIVMWTFNGQAINGINFIQKEDVLIIKKFYAENEGTYSCHAKNKFGISSRNITVKEIEPVLIIKGPEDVTVTEGEIAEFPCYIKAQTSMKAEVTWFKDTKRIYLSPRQYKAKDNTLYLMPAFITDAGTYECHASSGQNVVVASAKLIVNKKPISKVQPVQTKNDTKNDSTVILVPFNNQNKLVVNYSLENYQDIIIRPIGKKGERKWTISLKGNQIILINEPITNNTTPLLP